MKKMFNLAANNFLDAMNSVLNKYIPLKKVNKQKLTFIKKLWMTSRIQKSIYIPNGSRTIAPEENCPQA